MKYDVIAIGSGVGLAFINKSLEKGLKCALIEKGKFGGTCLTRGCIPSKILIQPADLIRSTQRAKKLGLSFNDVQIDFKYITNRMWNKVNTGISMEQTFKKRENLDIYYGVASFINDSTLKVTNKNNEENIIEGDKILISCGARSFVPNVDGLEATGYITYETFYGDSFPDELWKDVVIIGGGVIGVEFAHMMSSYGTNVSIVEISDSLLQNEDKDIRLQLYNQFIKYGINISLNTEIIKVSYENNKKAVHLLDKVTNEKQIIFCDEIIVAAGIQPNTDITGIHNTSIKTTDTGWIITNEYLETNVKNVWAIGDVNGKFQFRHKANYEMFTLTNNIYGDNPKKKVNYSIIPWAVFSYPQIAHLGLTEEQALQQYDKVLIGKLKYSNVVKGYSMGYDSDDYDNGFVKIILSENMKIIGAHVVGPYASMLIQPYVVLMSTGCICKLDGFTDQIDSENISENEYILNPLHDIVNIHPSLNEVAGWIYHTVKWVER